MESTSVAPLPAEVNVDKLQGTKYDLKRDLIGYGEEGLDCEWPDNKKVAVSFVLNYEEGGERSLHLGDDTSEFTLYTSSRPGPMPNRAYEVETEYDYGSRVGVWRILKLFKKFNNRITAYAVGKAFERNIPVAKAFVRDGHEIASHAYRWIPYRETTPEVEKAFIKKQLATLKKTAGCYPAGWYYGRQSTHSLALLHEAYKEMDVKLNYVSDAYGDDIPYWMDVPAEKELPPEKRKGMLMVPYSLDCNDYRFLNPHGFRSPGQFFEHLKNAFDILYDEGGKMMTVALHCRIMGKPAYFKALKDFVEYISAKDEVWVPTRNQIANHFRENFPYSPST